LHAFFSPMHATCLTHLNNILQVTLSLAMPWRHTGGAEVWLQPFLTPALDWGEWSTSCLSHFAPKNPLYPLNGKMGGSLNWSGFFGEEKNVLLLAGSEPLIVQPVA
jgi:hypothetical protein